MNYHTEDMQRIAQEVAKRVQEGKREKPTESQEPQPLAEFEVAFREGLRQIGTAA